MLTQSYLDGLRIQTLLSASYRLQTPGLIFARGLWPGKLLRSLHHSRESRLICRYSILETSASVST